VPIGHAEARQIAELVDSMPPERQTVIRDRFEAALDRLDEAGLLEKVRGYPEVRSAQDRQELGLEYFRAWVDCPFLEDEMCSIHEERPLACREYLVTSDAHHCSDPNPENVRMVKLPKKLSYVLYRFGDGMGKDEPRWIPLVLALEWAEEHADDEEPVYPGKPLFENFVRELGGGR
jgi:Fe-S-cluster containining protein